MDKELYKKLKEELTVHHEGGSRTVPTDYEIKCVIEIIIQSESIGGLLYKFWQRSSDACPLECGLAEEQEAKFKEWVKTLDLDTLNAL